jgi:hypothetical protein
MSSKNCIVSVGVGSRYGQSFSRNAARLQQSINYHIKDIDTFFWKEEFPPNSPTHEEANFVFKAHALDYALKQNDYDKMFWMDSSIIVVNDFTPIIDYVEENKVLLIQDNSDLNTGMKYNAGQWLCDHSLKYLDITREESFEIPQMYSAFMGWNLRDETARKHLEKFIEVAKMDNGNAFHGPSDNDGICSKDERVKGHRHDQSVAAVLANQLGLELFNPKCDEAPHFTTMHSKKPKWIQYEQESPKENTILWFKRANSFNFVGAY